MSTINRTLVYPLVRKVAHSTDKASETASGSLLANTAHEGDRVELKKSRPSLLSSTKDVSIVDDYHGHQVADPFRALEILDSPATIQWWQAHNQCTEAYLEKVGQVRRAAQKWHQDIQQYTRESLPSEYGGNYFFSRFTGRDAQPVYYVRKGNKDAEAHVLFDPNQLSKDGTIAVSSWSVSPKGKLVAYTVSEAGSDKQTMRFLDVETGKNVYEDLQGLVFTDAIWDENGKGVIYSRPATENVGSGKHFDLYHHILGSNPSEDKHIYSYSRSYAAAS
jgi:prolyl oligopeptidase